MIQTKKRTCTRKYRKKNRCMQSGGILHPDRTYVFIIAYRARPPYTTRRGELKNCIKSIINAFTKYKKKYKIIIVEQNNDYPFNMGILKNIGFLEEEKLRNTSRVYIHINADYTFDSSKEFPKELDAFDGNGFLEIYNSCKVGNTLIGSCTCFNSDVFKKINGFPTNIYGWGAEDNALLERVNKYKVPHIVGPLMNNGWIIVDTGSNAINLSKKNSGPVNLKKVKNDSATNGLTTTVYTVDGDGEFNDTTKKIVHKLINFEYNP